MGRQSYMRSALDRNVVMRRIPVMSSGYPAFCQSAWKVNCYKSDGKKLQSLMDAATSFTLLVCVLSKPM